MEMVVVPPGTTSIASVADRPTAVSVTVMTAEPGEPATTVQDLPSSDTVRDATEPSSMSQVTVSAVSKPFASLVSTVSANFSSSWRPPRRARIPTGRYATS